MGRWLACLKDREFAERQIFHSFLNASSLRFGRNSGKPLCTPMTEAPSPAPVQPGTADLHRLIESHLLDLRAFVDLNLGPLLRGREAPSDIVQSTIRQVLERGDRIEFRGERQFRAYLRASAANKILEKHRHHVAQRRDMGREHRPASASDILVEKLPDAGPSPSTAAQHQDDLERLRGAFDKLSDEDRRVLSLKRIFRLSTEEIADELGIAPRTVNWRLLAAQARLAAALER